MVVEFFMGFIEIGKWLIVAHVFSRLTLSNPQLEVTAAPTKMIADVSNLEIVCPPVAASYDSMKHPSRIFVFLRPLLASYEPRKDSGKFRAVKIFQQPFLTKTDPETVFRDFGKSVAGITPRWSLPIWCTKQQSTVNPR